MHVFLLCYLVLHLCSRFGHSMHCRNGDRIRKRGVNDNDIKTILHTHNDWRNKVAGGDIRSLGKVLPSAANMKKLVWDSQLALSAQAHADECVFEYFKPNGTKYSQNVMKTETPDVIETSDWEKTIQKWKHEIIWGSIQKVGCGYVQYTNTRNSENPEQYLHTCHYTPACVMKKGVTLYKVGKPCQTCKCDKEFKNLCAPQKNTISPKKPAKKKVQVQPVDEHEDKPAVEHTDEDEDKPTDEDEDKPTDEDEKKKQPGILDEDKEQPEWPEPPPPPPPRHITTTTRVPRRHTTTTRVPPRHTTTTTTTPSPPPLPPAPLPPPPPVQPLTPHSMRCDDGSVIEKRGLTSEEQEFILDIHNSFRDAVAKGQVSAKDGNLPPGTNMKKMVWDQHLADSAQAHADMCIFAHSRPQPAKYGTDYGQNLFIAKSSRRGYREPQWERAFDGWANEKDLFRVSTVDNYYHYSPTGHFTQIIWYSVSLLGCGYTHYTRTGDRFVNQQLYTCHYLPRGNVGGSQATVYNSGKPCTSCTCDSKYQNLCI